jgi:integrase
LIASLPHIAEAEYVFTTTAKTPVSGWSRAKALMDKQAANLNNKRALPGWRVHDLRRSFATGLQRLGVSLQVIEALLGHVSGSRAGVVGIYQRHGFDAEKKVAVEAWARHVALLVSGKPGGKVIRLRAAP